MNYSRDELAGALENARAAKSPHVAYLSALLAEHDRKASLPSVFDATVLRGANSFLGGLDEKAIGAMGAIGGEGYAPAVKRYQEQQAKAAEKLGPVGNVAAEGLGMAGQFALPPVAALAKATMAPRGATFATRALGSLPLSAAEGMLQSAGHAQSLEDVPEALHTGLVEGSLAGPALELGASAIKGGANTARKIAALQARWFGKRMEESYPAVGRIAQRVGQTLQPNPSLSRSDARALVKQGDFTGDIRTGQSVLPQGIAYSAFPEAERTIPELTPRALQDYTGEMSSRFRDPANKLGAWKNPDTGQWELNTSRIAKDIPEGITQGAAANQQYIYDLANKLSIAVPDTAAKREALLRRYPSWGMTGYQ